MTRTLTAALTVICAAGSAQADGHAACAAGNTLEDGVLTIATGNPAYYPWVMNDTSRKRAKASKLLWPTRSPPKWGFEAVTMWSGSAPRLTSRSSPARRNFDFNLQQYSITPEAREEVDGFLSDPYYSAAPMAVLTWHPVVEAERRTHHRDVLQGAEMGSGRDHHRRSDAEQM